MFRFPMIRQSTCIFGVLIALASSSKDARAEEPAAANSEKSRALTSDEVARRATVTSPAAEEKQHEVEAARAQLDKALYDFYPTLTWSANYTRLSPVSSPSLGNVVLAPGAEPGPVAAGQPLVAAPLTIQSLKNSTSFTGTLNLPLSDYVFRLFQARDAAGAQLGSAEQTLQATRREADFNARAMYYQWVEAELDSSVARDNLQLGQENLSHVKALAAAGSASGADVARIEATVASSELVLVQTQNLALLERERLKIAMHDAQAEPYRIGEDFEAARVSDERLVDIESLVSRAQRNRPELRALSFQVRAYDRQAAAARTKALPRLDATAVAQVANPNLRYFPPEDKFHSSWQVGLTLSYAPFDTMSGLADVANLKAKAKVAEALRRELLDSLHFDAADAALAYRNAVAGLDSTARRLAAAETSYGARDARFLVGKATTVELTEAQTELFNARLDAARAKVSIKLARARIAYVSGDPR